MTTLLNEVQAMQNPALGAGLLWRFVCGHSPRTSPKGTPLPLAFVVLPLVFHARSTEELTGTLGSSGLRKFEGKFNKGNGDILLSLQPRMLVMRNLSMRSLRIALRAELVTLVPSEAVLWPRSTTPAPDLPKAVNELLKAAEKLGNWCRDLSLFEVAGILKVDF
jgi:hypothetical protein